MIVTYYGHRTFIYPVSSNALQQNNNPEKKD